MKCFRCAQEIVVLAEDDPRRQSDEWHYFPAMIVEVYEPGDPPARCAVICWACMHEVQPDMWMNRRFWEETKPALGYNALPRMASRDDYLSYAAFAPG